jgi:hypothetical protein
MKKMLVLALAALAVSGCVTVMAPAGPARSVFLGESTVAYAADHDVIGVGRYEGSFRSIEFQVEKNDVEIFNLVVVYANGEREKIGTRLVFRQGTRSRLIDLDGGKRHIQSIQFTYKTVGKWKEGQARVAVFGVR